MFKFLDERISDIELEEMVKIRIYPNEPQYLTYQQASDLLKQLKAIF